MRQFAVLGSALHRVAWLVGAILLTSSVAYSETVPTNLSMRPAPRVAIGTGKPARRRWIVAQATPTPTPAQPTPAPAPEPAPATEPAPAPAPPAPPPVDVPAPATTPAPAPEPAPAPAPEPEATPIDSGAEDENDDTLTGSTEEIFIVTGSLIERKELTTPSPVTVVSHEDMQQSGKVSVGDVLQNLPAQANGLNTQTNNGGNGSIRVSIRGLGEQRTLVLINGRRVVPGGIGADSAVDLNAIPLAMIDHVEVLKDGASAIYGSDAVGGVVNIITRSDFSGQEASAYTGSSQRGDGVVYDLNLTLGSSNKKSTVVFSAGYSQVTPIFAGNRSWSSTNYAITDWNTKVPVPQGSTAVPGGYLQTDEDSNGSPDVGNDAWNRDVLANCPTMTCTRDPITGKWKDFDELSTQNDTYNAMPENYLVTPSERYNVFSSGSYHFGEKVRAFYEGMYFNRRSEQMLAPVPLFVDDAGLKISSQSIYNPYGKDISHYRRRFLELDNRYGDQTIGVFRMVGGLDGQLPDNLPVFKNGSWELSYNFGRTDGIQRNRGDLIKSHLAAALGPSYRDADGNAHCGTPTAPGPDGCVPLDLLGGAVDNGQGSVTPAMADYLTYTGISTGYNQQNTLLATMRGPIARTPGGGFIAAGLGSSFRDESGGSTPDPMSASGDGTGNASDPINGGFHVFEQFAELSIVPVMEKDFLKWAELSLAARTVEYSSFGFASTWKTGALVRVKGGFALRGTYSTAFRAPAISELYSGNGESADGVSDPCDHTAGPLDPVVAEQCAKEHVPEGFKDSRSQLTAVIGGNPELDPETAKVFTGGMVWEVPQVKGLSFTLDYFNFRINHAIQTIGSDVILANCYRQSDHTNCDKIHRRPDGAIDYIDDKITNIGGNATSGLAFAVAYGTTTAHAGRFAGQVEGTYLFKYQVTNAEGKTREGRGVYDLGLFPTIKAKMVLMWGLDSWGGGTNLRYLGSFKECEKNDCNLHLPMGDDHWRTVKQSITGDLFASYTTKSSAGRTMVSGGVNNVLDSAPSTIYKPGPDADAGGYDFIGRYFYVRLTQAF